MPVPCSTIAADTPSSARRPVIAGLTPPRRRGFEYLEDPGVDPALVRRSLADVARANRLFGGTRAVLAELDLVFAKQGSPRTNLTLLDVGTGAGDIPAD